MEGNTTHPFLEQTVLNLAIYYRSNESYNAAYQLFNQLKNIQENMFGPEGESLVYTYKNIGVCLLALQESKKAEEAYLKALAITEKLKSSRKEGAAKASEIESEDYEQLASIYFNLYLSSL